MNKNNDKKSNPFKHDRIESEIERELQMMVDGEIKDPRVTGNANVTEVKVSPDLSYCRVYVEINVEDEIQKNEVLEGLNNASGYLRAGLARALNLRKTPELNFVIDDTAERASHIEKLIKEIHKN